MKIIGIDLGTSNCCISYIHSDGKMEIIRDEKYKSFITIPSIVNIEDESILVGHEVDRNHMAYNKNIFHSFKRLIGHNIDDIYTTNLKEILNYKIDSCENKIVCVTENGKQHQLEDIIFLLLRKIKVIIEDHLHDEEWSCIVTVPAYFKENQKKITMNAIKLAKMPIVRLLNEPTAASYAYLYHNNVLHESTFNKKILVIDYGAGTLDLTVLEIDKDEEDTICNVLGIYGDNNFGGIDITKKIYKTMFNDSEIDTSLKMRISENIKLLLSSQGNAQYFCNELQKTFNYSYEHFLTQLDEFCDKIFYTINEVIRVSEINKEDIDDIILVGGSFKIPYFRKKIADYFNKIIDQIRVKVSNVEHLLYEDIAVSLGASVYGYFMNMSKDVILVDRLPLSIGIEVENDEIAKIINRNSIIPICHTKLFTPKEHDISEIDINIYQGESLFKQNCEFIGTFTLTNLPKNRPTIFVNINIDHNGLISVHAHDKRNDTHNSINIETKDIKKSDEEIEEVLKNYEISILDEQLYKKVIDNFYTLINFLDKVSYQLNFNLTLELTDDVKDVMRRDIELIINKMNNSFIVKKYKINLNLVKKCIILNDLKYIENPYKELTNIQIENYNDLLTKLKYYLLDRYEMYLLMEEDDMVTKNQVSKLEVLDDDDKNIDKDLYNVHDYNDSKTYEDTIDAIEKRSNSDEYKILCQELTENLNNFGLTEEGVEKLRERLSTDTSNYTDENYIKAIDEINELCLYLVNSY